MRRAVRGLMAANLIGLLYLPLLEPPRLARPRHHRRRDALVLCRGPFLGRAPALSRRTRHRCRRPGRHADGLLYLANILGSAAGSILTGFVLMEYLGLIDVGVALVVAGLLCTILLLVDARPAALAQDRYAPALRPRSLSSPSLPMPRWSAHVLETLQWKGSANAKPFGA